MTMKEISAIANRAQTLGKARPADRWVAFQKLAAAADLNNRDQLDALASLYHTFAPKPTRRKMVTAFDWLALAVNAKDHRPNLRGVSVQDGMGYATDGHRLHSAPLPDMADGFYDLSGVPVENPGTYPDVHKLIHSVTPSRLHSLEVHLGEIVAARDRGKPVEYQALHVMDDTAHVNRRYLQDALRFCDGDGARFGQDAPGKGVMLELGGERMAIIMPVDMSRVQL